MFSRPVGGILVAERIMKFSLTPSNIAKIPDGELPGAMFSYYIGYSEHVRKDPRRKKPYFTRKEGLAFDRSLPRGLRLVHSYTRFDGDVINGGLSQYFGNHLPEEVKEDLEALKTVGATESAKVLEEAIAIYKRDYGWPSKKRKACAYDPWDHPDIERLDHIRCDEDAGRRDYAILDSYLRQRLDECILPVEVECKWIAELLRPPKRRKKKGGRRGGGKAKGRK